MQNTINERLKFVIEELGMSARAFSLALGVPDSNTRNYLDKGTKLNSEYIEKMLLQFSSINPTWFLTGNGEPFVGESSNSGEPRAAYQKNISGIAQTGNNSKATQNNITLDDCKKDLQSAQEKIALLTSQLADKERTIQILLDKSGK